MKKRPKGVSRGARALVDLPSPDPLIARDWPVVADRLLSIDRVCEMERVVGLQFAPALPTSAADVRYFAKRYENWERSFAVFTAGQVLLDLWEQAEYIGLIADRDCALIDETIAPKLRKWRGQIDRWISEMPDDHPFALELHSLKHAVLVAAHLPEQADRLRDRKRAHPLMMSYTRAVRDRRSAEEQQKAFRQLEDVIGRAEARALRRYLSPDNSSGESLEARIGNALRNDEAEHSEKRRSVKEQFVREYLSAEFQRLFQHDARGSSQPEPERDGAAAKKYGPFVRFADWFFASIGDKLKPRSITKYVGSKPKNPRKVSAYSKTVAQR